MNASGQTNLKVLLAVALIVGAAGFLAWRLAGAFSDRPPAWLRQQKRIGTRLVTGPQPDLAWNQFQRLLKEGQRDAALGSLQFLELQGDGKNAAAWTIERLVNQGFIPLQNFQLPPVPGTTSLLGYYALDGTAIPYTTRRPPARSDLLAVTLNLREPVAPGGTQLVIRIQRRPSPAQRAKDGSYRIGLGRLPKTTAAAHVRGVRLPEGAALLKFTGGDGAIVSTGGVAAVGWINTRLTPPDQPLSATFTLKR
jgi:hypothetical protein